MTTPQKLCRRTLRLGFLTLLTLIAGCNGCKDAETEKLTREELAKKREKEREALVVGDQLSLPIDLDRKIITVKPGHWHESIQTFKSNREDLQVVLASEIYYGADKANLPSTNFVNEYTRRVTLPKGQEKTIGLQFYVPPTTKKRTDIQIDPVTGTTPLTALRVNTELRSVPLMNPIPNSEKRPTANELKPHTYQLIVLSPKVLEYQYPSHSDAVRPTRAVRDFDTERLGSYDGSMPSPKDNQIQIPHSMLTMTSVAVIVWDDISSDELSELQMNAIIDWVHWGGQLIINGPTSWSRLQNSPLAKYLPSSSVETRQLTQADFQPMINHWSTSFVNPTHSAIPIEVTDKTMGLKFTLNERGNWLPQSGEMVAESQVGRGRIVVTGFSLRDPGVFRWSFFSSFFSTGLLRRPPREVYSYQSDFLTRRQQWSGPLKGYETDPTLHSNFRLLTRDLPSFRTSESTTSDTTSQSSDQSYPQVYGQSRLETPTKGVVDRKQFEELGQVSYEPIAWAGAGGWNDYSGVAAEAVTALRAAAGIELPQRSTILKLLGGYLICLVPLNWLVFRLMRRLEYAWIAAPIMAIIGVVVVGKVARLDIGFARRTTEIAVLECYGDYPRAHLTQYVALYTSLSTNYTVQFPESDSVAMPMAGTKREIRRAQTSNRKLETSFGRSDGVVLEPLTVYSNSTEMLHAEQIVTLDSPFRVTTNSAGDSVLQNTASFPLYGATLIRRPKKGEVESAWLGYLAAGESKSIDWKPTDAKRAFENWTDELITQRTKPDEEQLSMMQGIWIGGLIHQIGLQTPLVEGQTRLIAYTDKSLGALQISPSQDQFDKVSIVVAHLSPAALGPIVPEPRVTGRDLTSEPLPKSEADPAVDQ